MWRKKLAYGARNPKSRGKILSKTPHLLTGTRQSVLGWDLHPAIDCSRPNQPRVLTFALPGEPSGYKTWYVGSGEVPARTGSLAVDTTDQAILDALAGGDGLATQEIATAIELTPRATRTRLAKLVERGLVREIGASPQDPKRRYFRSR